MPPIELFVEQSDIVQGSLLLPTGILEDVYQELLHMNPKVLRRWPRRYNPSQWSWCLKPASLRHLIDRAMERPYRVKTREWMEISDVLSQPRLSAKDRGDRVGTLEGCLAGNFRLQVVFVRPAWTWKVVGLGVSAVFFGDSAATTIETSNRCVVFAARMQHFWTTGTGFTRLGAQFQSNCRGCSRGALSDCQPARGCNPHQERHRFHRAVQMANQPFRPQWEAKVSSCYYPCFRACKGHALPVGN
jgi:hypothetical protein